MTLSGVERLVQHARDLAVEPERAPRRAGATNPPRPASDPSSDGIKLSLSSAATGTPPTDSTDETPRAHPTDVAPETLRAKSAEPTDEASRAKATDGPHEKAESAAVKTLRSGNAVAAYQRPGAAALGQRIAVRA